MAKNSPHDYSLRDVGGTWRAVMVIPLLLLVLSIFAGLGFFLMREVPLKNLVILTGPKEGAYHRIGERIEWILNEGNMVSDHIKVESTSGSEENAQKIRNNNISALALVQADTSLPSNARLVMPLYQEYLYILGKSSEPSSGISLEDYLSDNALNGKMFLGEEGSGTQQMANRVLSFFGVKDIESLKSKDIMKRGAAVEALKHSLEKGTDELTTVFLLDTYPSDDVESLINAGAILLPLSETQSQYNEVATLTLLYPMYDSFVLPSHAYAHEPPIQSISVQALLVASTHVPNWIVREVTSRIFEQRVNLYKVLKNVDNKPLPALESLREQYNPSAYMTAFHPGAEEYYRRNEPSVLSQNAELFALVITLLGIVFSSIMYIVQRINSGKKNRIDRYYNLVREISKKMPDSGYDDLIELREELDNVRELAFEDLVHEKVEANESFLIFQTFMQGQVQSIEAKLTKMQRC